MSELLYTLIYFTRFFLLIIARETAPMYFPRLLSHIFNKTSLPFNILPKNSLSCISIVFCHVFQKTSLLCIVHDTTPIYFIIFPSNVFVMTYFLCNSQEFPPYTLRITYIPCIFNDFPSKNYPKSPFHGIPILSLSCISSRIHYP